MPTTLLGMQSDDALEKINHTYVMVGNTSTPVILKNPKRRFLLLINDSNEDIYISIGVDAKMHEGILLNKNGGSVHLALCESSMCNCEVYAIQGLVNPKRLLVTEGE